MKKHLQVLLSMMLTASLLCGCGALDSITGGKRAQTAQEVVEHYSENVKDPNMHLNMAMGLKYTVSAEGVSMEIPISIKVDSSILGHNSHSTMNMEATMFGTNVNQTQEIYTIDDKGEYKSYTKSSDDDQWYVSDITESTNEAFDMTVTTLNATAFENATMEYNSKEKTYKVVQTMQDFLKSGNVNFDDLTSNLGTGMNSEDIKDFWKDATVEYVFNNEYNLVSIDILNATYSGPYEVDGQTIDIAIELHYNIKCSSHGQITEKDVAVPSEAIDTAVPSITIDYGDIADDTFGGYDEDSDYTVEDETQNNEDETQTEEENDTQSNETQSNISMTQGYDMLGAYNGVAFTGQGDSWKDTFGADGWEFDTDEDGQYAFAIAKNSKYGEYVEAYAYNKDSSNTTKADIEAYGTYGYQIDLSSSETQELPNITWNGLTFGASTEEIKSVYGTQCYEYEGTMFTSLEYEVADNMNLTFYVYPDKGLMEVRLAVYNF